MDRHIQPIGFAATYRIDRGVVAALFGSFVRGGHPASEDVDGAMESLQMKDETG
jgi:hypothetical protein